MDAVFGRFTTIDPMAEQYYSVSPYAYCINNPVIYIDPTGMLLAPYYDEDGNFLGVDENGFTGNIFITTASAFGENSTNGIANSTVLQSHEATNEYSKVGSKISSEAKSKIYTDVLSKMQDIKIDNLYNGRVSIREKQVLRNNIRTAIGYNDPVYRGFAVQYSTGITNNQIRITVEANTYTDLNTVESIWNNLGIHEYWGHGIKGWTGKDHWRAYEAQIKHHTFKKLTPLQQKEIINRRNDYLNGKIK